MKKFFRNCLLLVLGTIIALLLCEVLSRILVLSSDSFPVEYEPSKSLGYKMKPNSTGVSIFRIHYEINSKGLRDYEYTYEKPEGVFRILVLGDSVALGYGVEMEDSFPKLLEKSLNSVKQNRYQVINAAVAGYNTIQERNYLQEDGLRYSPDLVIVIFLSNDITSRLSCGVVRNGMLVEQNALPLPLYIKRILRKSAFYHFVAYRYKATIRAKSRYDYKEEDRVNRMNKHWPKCKQSVKNMIELAKSNNIKLIFIFYPSPVEITTEPLSKKMLFSLLEDNKINFIDLSPLLKQEMQFRRVYLKSDSIHPNQKTHQLIAQTIYNYLCNKKFFVSF